jgi:putative membrane protein (TIGR04086 family)
MNVKLSHLHWGRAFLTGLLVAILVIIFSAVLNWVAVHIWTQPNQQLVLEQVLSWSTLVLQLLLTVGGGLWLARNVEREAPLHGLLMGLFTVLIFLPFSLSSKDAALVVPISSVLTIAAGWLGGVLGSRER